ncbi:ABC transporter ATP-binding protein [Amycolatopsis sp. 195334CR]|uniref:ABC transporter ATP-binding protein n=1 Tax=Amycolatopsis sp. 195334CR TaxID=2814588 RepID=UPI001A8E1826|nr:ABC transporter ATP-binding protein [Amycolatopsis sp. 195334CR]MBN6038140.1 ABC transporter ATP-binding protein [Amycolatopsis sp. 195334CR]
MIRTMLGLLPWDQRRRVVTYAGFTVVSVLLRATGAVLLVPLVSALFTTTPADAVPWLGALTAATVAGWAVDSVTARLGFDLGFAVLDRGQRDLADRLTEIRLDWFSGANTATARQAVAATGPDLVGLVVNLLTPMIGAVLLPAAIALALLPLSWPLGLAALAGVPVLLGALWATGRITRRADAAAADANTELTERIVEFARTQQALRAARRVEPARSSAGAALATQHGATLRLVLMQIPGQVLFSVASQFALIALAGTTTLLTVRGSLTAPEAIALIVVIARYLEPITTLGDLAPALETIRGTLDRIRAVLAAPVVPTGDAVVRTEDAPRIEFRQVSLRLGETQVLDGLSFTLEPGTTTAIVGPSGAGKSTILALIAGLHQPSGGQVLIDGVDAATLDAGTRRALTSVVFQHPYLFDGSVRDNVLAGHPEADDAQYAAAVGPARVGELTRRLPAGDNTVVGEAGTALSGGERQRVSIARALLKPAPVLLIDEATSALDTENEAAVVHALADDARARTRVIVAHRLSSIARADRVLFLERGRIVEDGTVDGLRAYGHRFAEFWRHQHDAAGWQVAPPLGAS